MTMRQNGGYGRKCRPLVAAVIAQIIHYEQIIDL
jgi:hypothetical protein